MEPIPDYLSSPVFWQHIATAAVILIIAAMILIMNARLLIRYRLMRRPMVWIALTPPANIHRTPEATEQLFSVVHGAHSARKLSDKLLGRTLVMSSEIVSTRKEGIRYLLQVEREHAPNILKHIATYIPEAKSHIIEHEPPKPNRVVEFETENHYVLPLMLPLDNSGHDPLAYVIGAMTGLKDNEEIRLQLIMKPVMLREARHLSHKILGNENILGQVSGNGLNRATRATNILGTAMSGVTDMASEVYMGTTYGYQQSNTKQKAQQQQLAITKRDRPARTLSAFELEVMETMHRKVTRPLFQVNLRLLVQGPHAKQHILAIRSALDGFSVPPYQALRMKSRLPIRTQAQTWAAIHRLPSLNRSHAVILSVAELGGLYHFPASSVSRTDNLITSLSRTLPAPVSLKSGRQLSVVIGENHHHGIITPIGLTEAERERHVYIIGGTGNGKTTMLFYSIVQDIRAGKGLAVLDPHGDLAERLLRYIPDERIDDVIYMNPDDLSHPIGLNLLELAPNLAGDDLLREKDLVTEATISVLRKIFSDDDSGGHRIEYVLRNSIQTALTLEQPTLFTIFELLNNAKYRRKVVKGLQDQNLKDFWDNELGKAGEFQRVKMAAGITAKIGRFLFSASARRVLEQHESTVNFEEILSTKKILICNFSKGLLGEDTSTLFGTTVLAKLQTAALRRAKLQETVRIPFYLYVDEFQNFATMSFVQMLSEARKYKLFLTMAEQSTSQQDQQRLVDIILANVGTVVCFRSGSPADERLVLPLFSPFIQQGEIANLPAYSYYVRIAAIDSQEPMSGVTIIERSYPSEKIAKRAIKSSRDHYTKLAKHESTGEMIVKTSAAKIERKENNSGYEDLRTRKSIT